VSATVADDAARQLRVPRSRFDVVARGRDPVRLGRRTAERRHAARERLGVGPDEILLLAVARHEHQKGLDVLLRSLPDVLAALPNARVLVAGRQGRQTGLLHDLANQLNLTEHVSFLGFRSDVPELLCAADLLIVPSRWEGMSGAVLEAMALELPVVASDLSPLREVVGDPEAVLVPPDRPDLLAVAIAGAVAENEGDGTARRVAAAHDLFRRRYTAEHGGGNGELLPAGHRDVTPAS
jgi:glycosyltransferase involved in cell wall biosynthesis